MTTEALKKENLRLSSILSTTETERKRLDGIIADKYAEVKKWNDLYNQLYKEKVVAPENTASKEIQRVTTTLAATEAEKNRLAGIIAEKNSEIKRWYDLYTNLYKEKMSIPQDAPAVEMKRLSAVLSDAEAEKNRLAGMIVEKDVEIKRWYDMYNNLYQKETVTEEHITAAEMERLTAVLADTEAEKNRLAGMIAEKDAEVRRWYDLYTQLHAS